MHRISSVILVFSKNMRPENHIRLFILVSVAWGLFWVGGLPEYYQQYSTVFMVLFDLIILPMGWFLQKNYKSL